MVSKGESSPARPAGGPTVVSGAPGLERPFLGQADHPQVRRCFWAKTPGGSCAHVETQPLAAVASQEPQRHRPSLCSHLPADCPLDWTCCSPGQRETSPGAASPARWLWRDVQDEGHQMRDRGIPQWPWGQGRGPACCRDLGGFVRRMELRIHRT